MFATNQQQYGNNVQPAQQPAASARPLSLDNIMQGGTPSAFSKDDQLGATVSGEIVSIEAQQQTDFTTGQPLYYQNGDPRPQVVIHVQTNLQNPNSEYDDGVRAIYVKGYNLANLKAAAQQAGVGNYPKKGDSITATFSSTKPSQQRGFNDAKLYTYQITPGKDKALDQAFAAPQQPAQPPMGQYQGQPAQSFQQTIAPARSSQAPVATAAPEVNVQQILQLEALGKSPAEIAGFLGVDATVVQRAVQQAADEPVF